MITVGGSAGTLLIVMMIAAASGAVGGFAYELFLSRGKDTGAVELPREFRRGRQRFYDLGWGASVILGAITAVAGLYIFPPLQQVSVTIEGQPPTTNLSYDLIKVAALSLILGSAAARVMTSLQERVLATINQQKAQVAEAVGNAQIEQVKSGSKAVAKESIDNSLQQNLLPEIEKMAADKPAADPQEIAQALTERIASKAGEAVQDRIEKHAEAAKETLNTAIAAVSAR